MSKLVQCVLNTALLLVVPISLFDILGLKDAVSDESYIVYCQFLYSAYIVVAYSALTAGSVWTRQRLQVALGFAAALAAIILLARALPLVGTVFWVGWIASFVVALFQDRRAARQFQSTDTQLKG